MTRTRFFELLLVPISLIVGYGLIEIGYRAYLHYTYAVEAKYSVAVQDAPVIGMSTTPGTVLGPFPINRVVSRKLYDADSHVVLQNRYRVNNLGWLSGSDYTRVKPTGEFRVAVIGDSMTGNQTSNVAWTDILQDRLNGDKALLSALGVSRIAVLNLGVPGASMQLMANPLSVIARRFDADMVVVNFLIEDLGRRHGADFGFEQVLPEPPAAPANEVQVERAASGAADLMVRGVEIRVFCSSGEVSPANPNCKPSPLWTVPPGRELSTEEVHAVKVDVARQFLLHRVLLSPRPLALLEVLGRSVIGPARAQIAPMGHSADAGTDIQVGLRAIAFVRRLHQHVLVTHNPLQWHIDRTGRPAVLDTFLARAKAAGHDVVQMEDHLPTHLGANEWTRWYMMPHDGHWSDYGGEVYGRAMYRVVRARLLERKGVADATAETACEASFNEFSAGRQLLSAGRAAEGAAALQHAADQLPNDIVERVKRAESSQDCGFAVELYTALAMHKAKSGDDAAAERDFEMALQISPNPEAPRVIRMDQRLASGDRKGGLSDLATLIAAAPKNASYRLRRAQLVWQEDPATARGDLTVALQEGPRTEYPTILFFRAQANSAAGNHAGTIEDTTAALQLSPGSGGLLFMRGNALFAQGKMELALKDFEGALEAMPGTQAFIQARNSARAQLSKR